MEETLKTSRERSRTKYVNFTQEKKIRLYDKSTNVWRGSGDLSRV